MKNLLVYPMAFYFFYMVVILTVMFRSRVGSIIKKEVDFTYFKNYVGQIPDYVIVRGRHYDNQFQVPMLFFMTCLTHMMINQVNMLTIGLAWAFVVSRMLHSFVHLGSNSIKSRVRAFGLGWLMLICLWVQLVYLVITTPA